jgi:hypothetical protein
MAKVPAKAASEMIKYIGERGITAAKKFFGNSKTTGVASLSDEQLGRGLNMFEKKKADKAGAKAGAKAQRAKKKAESTKQAETKKANREKKREPNKGGTQKGLRFKDKPTVDVDVESDAARSVDETNLVRGARSAGRTTNAPGKTNIGRASISNFIKDQMAVSPGMKARSKQDEAFRRAIANADTKAEKDKLRNALEKIRERRLKYDEAQQKKTGRKISQSLRGKKKKARSDYVNKDGEIIGNPTENQIKAAIRNAEARGAAQEGRVLQKYLRELQDKEAGRGQLERAGVATIDTSQKMIQDAKKALIAVYGQRKGATMFNDILSGAKDRPSFLVKIRSMVNKGKAEGHQGSHRASETGAVVGERKSRLRLADADNSNKTDTSRKQIGSRRAAAGNPDLDRPMRKGGMVGKPRTGSTDYRNGGMVMASIDNLTAAQKNMVKKMAAANKKK